MEYNNKMLVVALCESEKKSAYILQAIKRCEEYKEERQNYSLSCINTDWDF